MSRKFLIVENQTLYFDALKSTIVEAVSGAEVSRATSLALAKLIVGERSDIDIVLLELWLPDCRTLQGLAQLRMLRPCLPIIVVTAFSDEVIVRNVIAGGAAGFISKSSSRREIASAVRDVMNGHMPLPREYHPPSRLGSGHAEEFKAKLGTLTPQQSRVLQMLCEGMLNKQIAHHLGVGETTIKAHVSEILRKLGVASRTQAVLGVSRLGAAGEPSFDLTKFTSGFKTFRGL